MRFRRGRIIYRNMVICNPEFNPGRPFTPRKPSAMPCWHRALRPALPSRISPDAWCQRNRRCSWCFVACRRGIRSLPVRPWDRARTRYRRSRPLAGRTRFIPSRISPDAWSQRNRRCSWCFVACRRGIRSLPVRPWDKAAFATPISFAGYPFRSAILRGACRIGSR